MLRSGPSKSKAGRALVGWSLVIWAIYGALVPLAGWIPVAFPFAFGLLVGFQVLAALGIVILIVDRLRLRVEVIESQSRRLDGLLPVCSYCNRIRDENDEWQSVQTYIKRHSDAVLSHGICPECAKAQYPGFSLQPRPK